MRVGCPWKETGIRHTGVVTHTAAGVLLASVLLTGCGGGSDSDSAPKKAGPPTEAEWTAAYATYTDVGDAFNAAIGGATAYQTAKPCLALLGELDDSRNYLMREYAANWRKVIDQRNGLMADLGAGKIGFEQTPDRLERVNRAFTRRNDKLTRFTQELAKVSAAEEYQALDAIFVENGAKPESPRSSPSSS